MRPPGAFKIAHRARTVRTAPPNGASDEQFEFDTCVNPLLAGDERAQRILESLRREIIDGGESVSLRIRQIFSKPREIFRLELERPEMGYQRTTLLDRDALEQLLEADEIRDRVRPTGSGL